jgi:predicted DNA-binding protein (MmcQ/YjbR family)
MDEAQFNAFCSTLPATSTVVQWGDAHVWKVGGKVFAVGGWMKDVDGFAISFKCSPMTFEIYKDEPGIRPAPYLASRGMSWLQWTGPETLDTDTLRDYLGESHRLVAAGLTKRARAELGLDG